MTVAAYMITYMDRVVMSSAAPSISKEFGLSLEQMGGILAAFRWGYTLFQIPGGWLGDLIGPRRALTLIVLLWSAFTSLTALSWSAMSMMMFRFLFGVGEAGAFPIATRSLSRWMLPTERGFAQGVTHAGSRLGAAFTPGIVVALIVAYSWRAPFLVFGVLGIIWAILWYWYYRDSPDEHSSLNEGERELIRASVRTPSTKTQQRVPWKAILSCPNVWTLFLMYFCYSYCLAMYLDWFPTYLNTHRGFNLKQMGFYASLPLLAGTLGDLLGGWFSDWLGHRTGDLRMARKAVGIGGFLLAASAILPATFTANPYTSVWFTCLALFGLELTVGVSWAIPLDIGSDFAGSVSAVMNTANLGGAISPMVLPYLVRVSGWDRPFVVASCVCLLGAILFSRIDANKQIVR